MDTKVGVRKNGKGEKKYEKEKDRLICVKMKREGILNTKE